MVVVAVVVLIVVVVVVVGVVTVDVVVAAAVVVVVVFAAAVVVVVVILVARGGDVKPLTQDSVPVASLLPGLIVRKTWFIELLSPVNCRFYFNQNTMTWVPFRF